MNGISGYYLATKLIFIGGNKNHRLLWQIWKVWHTLLTEWNALSVRKLVKTRMLFFFSFKFPGFLWILPIDFHGKKDSVKKPFLKSQSDHFTPLSKPPNGFPLWSRCQITAMASVFPSHPLLVTNSPISQLLWFFHPF